MPYEFEVYTIYITIENASYPSNINIRIMYYWGLGCLEIHKALLKINDYKSRHNSAHKDKYKINTIILDTLTGSVEIIS